MHEIAETMEDSIETYVVVQRGTNIGFFEYHKYISNLDDKKIHHFKGCVSLTQSYPVDEIEQFVINQVPKDLDPLYYDSEKLR